MNTSRIFFRDVLILFSDKQSERETCNDRYIDGERLLFFRFLFSFAVLVLSVHCESKR